MRTSFNITASQVEFARRVSEHIHKYDSLPAIAADRYLLAAILKAAADHIDQPSRRSTHDRLSK